MQTQLKIGAILGIIESPKLTIILKLCNVSRLQEPKMAVKVRQAIMFITGYMVDLDQVLPVPGVYQRIAMPLKIQKLPQKLQMWVDSLHLKVEEVVRRQPRQ